MNPVFNEYIQFLKDNGVDIPLSEGYYWLDKQIIKAYGKDGKLYKLFRLKISDNLTISYSKYKNKDIKIESWQDTIERNIQHLQTLEDKSIKLIQEMLKKYQQYKNIVLNSSGKDSTITSYLVNQNTTDKEEIFNNTTLDCGDTHRYIKKRDITVVTPEEGFYKWIHKNIIPTRFSRGCCTHYKEKPMIDYLDDNERYLIFMGMRNQESAQRSDYQDEWKNEKWGSRDWKAILPIREWSDEDVWLYILWRDLDFNTKYRKGYSRVGCAIACPFYSKSTWVLDKYWYPKMYQRWHRILEQDFIDNFKWVRLNCTIQEYHTCWNGGLLRKEPTQEVINEFAQYKNIDVDVAKKYFNHSCKICNKKVNQKDVLAMNMKLLGRNIEEFMCKKHLKEYLSIGEDQWNQYIKEFKQTGCELF